MHNKRTSETSTVDTQALIDSGAEGKFIDQNYARTLGVKQTALKEPIKVLNVDGTWNKRGIITHYMELDLLIENRIKRQRLYITGLGKQKIILGFTWLKEMNPDINWQTGKIKWRPMLGNEDCADLPVNTPEQGSEEWVKPRIGNKTSTHFIEEIKDEEEWKNLSINSFSDIKDFNEITIRYIGTDDSLSDIWNSACSEDDIEEKWINTTLSPSQEFAIKQDKGKKKQTMEEIVPPEYHKYLDVFQEEVERFPKARS